LGCTENFFFVTWSDPLLSVLGREQRHCDGISRRHFLRIGGFSLSQVLRAEATSAGPCGKKLSHKTVIMI